MKCKKVGLLEPLVMVHTTDRHSCGQADYVMDSHTIGPGVHDPVGNVHFLPSF